MITGSRYHGTVAEIQVIVVEMQVKLLLRKIFFEIFLVQSDLNLMNENCIKVPRKHLTTSVLVYTMLNFKRRS